MSSYYLVFLLGRASICVHIYIAVHLARPYLLSAALALRWWLPCILCSSNRGVCGHSNESCNSFCSWTITWRGEGSTDCSKQTCLGQRCDLCGRFWAILAQGRLHSKLGTILMVSSVQLFLLCYHVLVCPQKFMLKSMESSKKTVWTSQNYIALKDTSSGLIKNLQVRAKTITLSSLCIFLFVRCLDVGRAH